MKISIIILLSIVVSLVINSCTESESSPVEYDENVDYRSELEKLFPLNINDSLIFSVDTLDLMTDNYENIGTRSVVVDSKTIDGNYYNYIFKEKYNLSSLIFGTVSKSRITENSLEFYIDSTGTSEMIPDSIDIDITLKNDEYIKLISYPYNSGEEWQVYNVAVNFNTFVFKVILITGKYVGSEELIIPGFTDKILAEKFEYNLELNIPDMSNPLVSNIQEYVTYAWFSKELGIVKMEGCSMLINPISGRGFDIVDSNKVSRYTINSYN